jgi:signal transduction histidine kinase
MAASTPNPASDASALEAERQRLAEALALLERDCQLLGYEIHDGIVQDLTAAAMLLEAAGPQATFASSESQESYAGGLRLLRDSIAQARQLIRGLATVELDESGLPLALRRLVDKFRSDHALPATLECQTESLRLPASVQHLLFRIAQEALYNVWKHAQASRVLVRLAQTGGELELTISDDGVGYDPSRISAGHFGLEGMHARARILGAHLQIESAATQGTRITVRLTVPQAV